MFYSTDRNKKFAGNNNNDAPMTPCDALQNSSESDHASSSITKKVTKKSAVASIQHPFDIAKIPVYVPTNLPAKVNPWWIAGLAEGEGCFSVDINKNSTMRLGEAVQLNFNITQLGSNRIILDAQVEYFGCGHVVINNRANGTFMYRVRDFSDLTNIIIPFFNQYPLVGNKNLDFADFCAVADLMRFKTHLTIAGLDQIKSIKSKMNRGRPRD